MTAMQAIRQRRAKNRISLQTHKSHQVHFHPETNLQTKTEIHWITTQCYFWNDVAYYISEDTALGNMYNYLLT